MKIYELLHDENLKGKEIKIAEYSEKCPNPEVLAQIGAKSMKIIPTPYGYLVKLNFNSRNFVPFAYMDDEVKWYGNVDDTDAILICI